MWVGGRGSHVLMLLLLLVSATVRIESERVTEVMDLY